MNRFPDDLTLTLRAPPQTGPAPVLRFQSDQTARQVQRSFHLGESVKDELTSIIDVNTIIRMQIVFDPAKDASNMAKHGVSLAQAGQMEWDTLASMPDSRRDYGELRMIGYAFVGARLYCVVFADRAGVRRIISLRKANDREVNLYAQNN
jgi:uncharacterized protein